MKLLELLITPPAINFIILVIGLALWKHRRASYILILTSAVTLYLASVTLISGPLLGLIEDYPPLTEKVIKESKAKAIIVLGAGRYIKAPEWGKEDKLSAMSLSRLKYAVWLSKQTGLQIIVSGGSPKGEILSEAAIMQKVLEKQFHILNVIAETKSNNTFENASLSSAILKRLDIKSAYIVTHASHMRRAINSFEYMGVKAVPAPLGYNTNLYSIGWETFIPSTNGLRATKKFMHEVLGMLWYKIHYYK